MEPPLGKGGIMGKTRRMRIERLDHLGIVAGVCEEIGLAGYLDARAGATEQQGKTWDSMSKSNSQNRLGTEQNRPLFPEWYAILGQVSACSTCSVARPRG